MTLKIIYSILFYILILPPFVFLIKLLMDKKVYFNFNYELNKKKKVIVFIVVAIFTSLAHVFLLNINYPIVGWDISLVHPRVMSMLLFAQKNGLAIEWASPLFGGGLLQYANPQYPQYSILYFLTLIMPFWNAYNLLTFLFIILGFISMFFILKDIFKFDYILNITGSIFFSFTGYYIYHLQVGHWTFLMHPLTAFLVWLFFSNRFSSILKILLGAITMSAMLFLGAIQTVFFYTCFTLLGVAAMLFEPSREFIKKCAIIMCSVILCFTLSISKMLPSFMLAKTIDRGIPMLYNSNITTIFYHLYYSFLLSPISFIEHFLSLSLYQKITYGMGLWERDVAIPFLVSVLIIIIFIHFKKDVKIFLIDIWKRRKLSVIFFAAWIYLYFDMLFDKGITHTIVPTLNNINLHLRIASSFIVPVIIIFIYLMKRFVLAHKNRQLFFITINVITILFFIYRFSYVFILEKGDYADYNISTGTTVWNDIKQNFDKYYVDNITSEKEVNILNPFLSPTGKLNSSGIPYEPIYGYFLQTFNPKEEGSPKKIVDGRFNFTHPNSLLFFDDDYKQFSGFALDEEDDLDKFLRFEKVDWKLPRKFEIANIISLYSHIAVFIMLILYSIYLIIKRRKV